MSSRHLGFGNQLILKNSTTKMPALTLLFFYSHRLMTKRVQYVAVFILGDFLSLKNGNPSFTELSPSHFAAVCYSVSDALTLSENHENEDRLLMRSNGGIGKKNSTMVGSSQKRAASKLPRVPPPKSLRKCVLIDNDCTLHKYSLQLPLNGRKLPMQRHLTSNK